MKKQIPAWMVLGIIMMVAAFCLAGTNLITKGIIDKQQILNEENARKAVFTQADAFEQIPLDEGAAIDSLFAAKKGEETIGFVGVTTVKGYGGPIQVIAGVNSESVITGVNVGGSSFAETAGLGAKAKDPAFTELFNGKKAPVKVIKKGETNTDSTVDAITAATITSSAVARGVNSIVKQVDSFLAPAQGATTAFAGGNAKASADGFGGPVAVDVTFDKDGTITAITIGDDQFSETEGFGAEALKPEFAQQFIGKKAPLKLEDIDAISGATITSEAVVTAVNKAMEQLSVPAQGATTAFAGGNAKASADGFGGPVAVDVTFDKDGTITALTIGDDQFSETEGFGAEALKPEFAQQFIGKKAPLKLEDIDAISGATITSEAVVTAVNKAMEQLSVPAQGATTAFAGGNAKASADGFGGPVAVDVTFDKDGTITALTIGDDQFSETEGFGAEALKPEFAQQFIGKKAPLKLEDIDAISGATITSEAVVDAINAAQKQAAPAEKAPAEKAPAEEKKAVEETLPEGAVTVSKDGFAGPVAVTVQFGLDNATIESVKIGDDQFGETEGLGAEALKPEFAQQFIGKKAPLKLEDIDAISGATITSEAIVEAINEAQKQVGPAEEASAEKAPAEEKKAVEETLPEGAVTVSKDGFAGPVAVTVQFGSDNATIESVKIGDDQFGETEGLGAEALKPEFAQQFIGKKAPLKLEDIDAISGATITSEAIVEAINEAQKQVGPAEEASAEKAPAEEKKAVEETLPEGAVTISKDGFAGPVAVTVQFGSDNATIESVKIGDDQFGETEGFGAEALKPEFGQQFIGKKAPLKLEDIDAISGATITSEAVVDAINEAQKQISNKNTSKSVEAAPATERTASAKGFSGDVTVKVGFNQDGVITSFEIEKNAFGDVEGFGKAVLDETFTKQMIGKKAPLSIEDVDAVSFATQTVKAAVEAVNVAYAQK